MGLDWKCGKELNKLKRIEGNITSVVLKVRSTPAEIVLNMYRRRELEKELGIEYPFPLPTYEFDLRSSKLLDKAEKQLPSRRVHCYTCNETFPNSKSFTEHRREKHTDHFEIPSKCALE